MTETKSTRKPRTTRTAKTVEKVEVVENVVGEVEQPTKRELTDSTKIKVMNNTTGRYGYIGKSGYSFELEEYGDIAEIPFSELRSMMASSQKRHITDAFIIILDEDAIQELNYTKLYENILDDAGVEELLRPDNIDKLSTTLPNMPLIMRETVVSIARQKVKSGELFDTRIMNIIKDVTKINIGE